MISDTLKNAGIDYDDGVKRFMGRADLYIKTLSKFPKNDTMERVRADYAARDNDALLRDAHELKGMCGNMSMTLVFRAADAVVALLRGGGFSDGDLSAAMSVLNAAYDAAKAAVSAVAEASL